MSLLLASKHQQPQSYHFLSNEGRHNKDYIYQWCLSHLNSDTVSWELAELSLNSQGTHRLIQTLPSPIYTHIRHRHRTGSHRRSQLTVDRSHTTPLVALHKRCTPRFTNASLRPLSGTTHGHALSPLRATHGLRHSASQDVRTHRRQTHQDNNSQVETPAVATDAPAHSRAMLPSICNATCSGEHSVSHTTFFPVFFWSSGACAVLDTF